MVNLRLRKIVSTLSILGCPRLRLLCKHPPNLKSIPPISQGMRPSREQKIVQNSAGRKANITFSSNGKPLYTAKAQWCHAQQQLVCPSLQSKYFEADTFGRQEMHTSTANTTCAARNIPNHFGKFIFLVTRE